MHYGTIKTQLENSLSNRNYCKRYYSSELKKKNVLNVTIYKDTRLIFDNLIYNT